MSGSPGVVLVETADRIATVTLNRPAARNALNVELLAALPLAMAEVEADGEVDVVVLTGADPAFCAGLDLRELGSTGSNLGAGPPPGVEPGRPWPRMTKPVIGAVNGPAVTGGFEIALSCDLLVASERATFGDTHARVGVLPGWGLTVHLAAAIGVRRAKEMSLTGNFVGAEEAMRLGLVNHVVAHDDLLPFARSLAADMVGVGREAVAAMRAAYDRVTATTVEEGLALEREIGREWLRSRGGFDPATVEARRSAIIERGSGQT